MPEYGLSLIGMTQVMERQAREIATWGTHVYVKIPVTNTRREPAYDLGWDRLRQWCAERSQPERAVARAASKCDSVWAMASASAGTSPTGMRGLGKTLV